jgi:hypothetical protein
MVIRELRSQTRSLEQLFLSVLERAGEAERDGVAVRA